MLEYGRTELNKKEYANGWNQMNKANEDKIRQR
jgi:hypothetical protein